MPSAPSRARRSDSASPAPAEGRANVYQVAERAGVSAATVSKVLNNRGRVGADTRQRVFDAARDLGFRPQVQVRSRQVAVVGDNMLSAMRNWGYYREVWSHLAFALYKRDMAMILPDSADDLRHRHLDGILVVGEYPALRPALEELVRHTPVVLTDDFSSFADSGWVVRSDEQGAGRLAAARFASAGRRRPGFVGSWGAQDRAGLAGFREGLLAAGLECREEFFCLRQPDETFYGAVSRVLRAGADALYVPGSNYEALEAYNVVANVLRLRVPADVALIGGEVHGVSKFLTPPMTAIAAPLADVAALAVETLAALMRGESPPRENTLPVRLVSRESA